MTELFRPEAVAHQQQKLLGSALLKQPLSIRILTAFFGVVIAGLLFVFFFFGFARSEVLSGTLQPVGGMVQATSGQDGVVTEVHVREGQVVVADALLFVVSGERRADQARTSRRVRDALAARARDITDAMALARQQSRIRQETAQLRLAQMSAQLGQIESEIALQQQRRRLVEDIERRYRQLQSIGALAQQTVDEKTAEALELRTRILTLQRSRSEILLARDTTRADLQELPLALERELTAARAELTTVTQAQAENDARLRWEVRAPCAGRVTMVAPILGQSVAAGESLVDIVPAGETLEAVLYASSRAVGLLRIDTPVRLRFDALPYQRYGQFQGHVLALSQSPVPAAAVSAGLKFTEPMYRVRVQITGSEIVLDALRSTLRPGMRVDATAMLEHRRFYQWALAPAIGLKQRLQ